MLYREAGDYKTSYADDAQTFPIAFDRWRYYVVLAVGFVILPLVSAFFVDLANAAAIRLFLSL